MEVELEYGNRELLLGELRGGEGIYYALNLSEVAVPGGINPSFFSCLHDLSPDLFACVSQSLVPTFDECSFLPLFSFNYYFLFIIQFYYYNPFQSTYYRLLLLLLLLLSSLLMLILLLSLFSLLSFVSSFILLLLLLYFIILITIIYLKFDNKENNKIKGKRLAEVSDEEYYGEVSEGEEVVNKLALIPRCNLGLELSEFGVCNSEDILWISVFSASEDLDRPRTFDLPFAYSACSDCSVGAMDCISNPWLIVSFVISFSFLFCSLCSLFVLFVYSNKRKTSSQ